MQTESLYLFGGDSPWDAATWTSSDDRVRGGSSISYLTVTDPERARFHGHLDTTTLGGAGFASQRTVGVLALDLSEYAGLVLCLGGGASGHKYTLTLKDTIPGDRGDGRDQAGLSWETDFEAPKEGGDIQLPWDKFRATYRGRDKPDAEPLDLTSIKRVSFMMRSFFGTQDGDFELVIHAIAAKKSFSDGDESDDEDDDLQKPIEVARQEETPRTRSWWRTLLCGLHRSPSPNDGTTMPLLLRALLPPLSAALALQAAVAVPSIAAHSDRVYDLSGAATFITVGALSLYLPSIRAAGAPVLSSLVAILRGRGPALAGSLNWRQVLLTGAVGIWTVRLGSYLFRRNVAHGTDSRFDEIKHSAPRFAVAFFFQALWVTLCLTPVLLVNAVPRAALATGVTVIDVLGLSLWAGGFAFEVVADSQKSRWAREKREKVHDEEFLTGGLFAWSRFPHYFGEITLWTGLATAAAGILARKPAQLALGFSGGIAGVAVTTALSFISPAFSAFLLLKVSGIPLSEAKYDKRYGDREDYQEWKKNTPKLIPRLW
ncbi:hypothetical protein G7Z17_g3835 [Cylindrodendrum hubeiense]|uniref:NADH:ubiquinone oxidoreductase intermediate-associated protein 30 domain-containing protein n=1 Tax=Cylindrodendrum hubeiense TaxID=595255 RepID=A0A9P5HKA5_9HYPO|nr:hypothetical protein G7Z17_g3835 [Cylindrodendrum hubeiense]